MSIGQFSVPGLVHRKKQSESSRKLEEVFRVSYKKNVATSVLWSFQYPDEFAVIFASCLEQRMSMTKRSSIIFTLNAGILLLYLRFLSTNQTLV